MFVVAGVVNVETSVPVEGFPLEYAPSRYPRGVASRVAGVGFGVANALSVLGSGVRLATLVGEDAPGRLARATVEGRGMSGPWVLEAGATPQSVVLYEPSGARMVQTDLKGLPEAVYPAEVFEDALAGADWAVVTNIGFARPLLDVAARAGVPVATDVQAIGAVADAYNADWMRAAEVVFCSHERLPASPTEWVHQVWERFGTPLVVVGCGGDGAVLGVRSEGMVRHVPAVAVRGVVNTVGAGDALSACFLHTLARTGDPHVAIERAVLFAGYKVGAPPGEDGLITESELAELAAGTSAPISP